MNIMKRFLISFLMISFLCAVYAQESSSETKKITVEDAVSLASANNISLKRQQISLDTLEKRNKTSWNSVSPSASLSGNLSKPLGENSDGYSYSVSASVSLTLTPSLYTAIRDAKLKYESGKTSYEEAARQIELNVRKAFYNLLYAKESIELQKRNMETAKIRYENNRDKFNRGQLSELDLLQSQYAYESQRPAVESLEISYQNSIASFKQMLGLFQDEKIELEGSLSSALPPESFSVEQTVDELPSIKKIKSSIEQQKNSLMATRFSAYGPSVTASYSYGKSGNDKIKEFDKLQTQNSLSVGVRIPLDGYLPWSNGALSVSTQKANLKDLELQLENEKTSAELNLQNSIKNILLKQSQMELLERNVQIAQKAYEMTLDAYNHGSRDLLSLQNTSDSLMKANLDRESHIISLISAVLDFENMLGIPFGTLGKGEY